MSLKALRASPSLFSGITVLHSLGLAVFLIFSSGFGARGSLCLAVL